MVTKFLFQIRDQITWCIDMGRVISSDEPIHNVSDAEAMLRQLEEHHVIMESREETFTRLLETGEKMIGDGHFATEEVTS
jgi:spectrin beta